MGLFLSCTKQPTNIPLKVTTGQIIGGTAVESGHFSATVALAIKSTNSNNRSQFCTGTIINHNTVITAAHCLAQKSPKEIEKLTIYIGEGSDQNYVGQYHATQVRIHPDFIEIDNANFTHDIAYITIQGHFKEVTTFPTTISNAKIDQLINTTPVTIVGFGTREDGSRGTKYKTDTYLIKRDQFYATTKSDMHDACHGDSGGSLYYVKNKKHFYIGITSHSAAPKRSADSKCGMSTNYVLASTAVEWYKEDLIAQRIEVLNSHREYQQALELAKQINTPVSSSYYLAVSRSYIGLAKYQQALKILNLALLHNPRSLAVQMEKIKILHNQINDYKQAKNLVLDLLMHDINNKELQQYTKKFHYPEDEIAYALGLGSLYDNHLGFNIHLVTAARQYFEQAYTLIPSKKHYLWYLNSLALENKTSTKELIAMVNGAPFDYSFISKQSDPAGATSRYYAFKSRNAAYLNAIIERFPQYKLDIQKKINLFLTDAITDYGKDIFEYLLTHYNQEQIEYIPLLSKILNSPNSEIIKVLYRNNIMFSQYFSIEQLTKNIDTLLKENYLNIATFLISKEANLRTYSFSTKQINRYFKQAVVYNDFLAADFFLTRYHSVLTTSNNQLIAIVENGIISYQETPSLLQNVLSTIDFSNWNAVGIFDSDMTLLEMVIDEQNQDLITLLLTRANLTPKQRDLLLRSAD